MCQTPLVCELISRTQTSVPLTKAKPRPKRNPTGIKRSCLFTTQSNTKASLSEPQGTLKTRRQPHCAPGGTSSKTRLASCSGDTGGIHWRITASRSGSILAGYSAGSTGKRYSAGYSAGSTGEPLWRDTRRDPLASRSAGYSAGSTGSSGGILGGIHWRAALAGYSAGSTGELLWPRDPVASRSGGILGGIHWRAALVGYSAGSTGEQLRRDTGRDPLASSSGGILGGIH